MSLSNRVTYLLVLATRKDAGRCLVEGKLGISLLFFPRSKICKNIHNCVGMLETRDSRSFWLQYESS